MTVPVGFLGTRATDDWPTDMRPKDWREMLMYLYPNGDVPLTALLGMSGSAPTTDPEFNWWTQTIDAVSGTLLDSGMYDEAALSTAYTTGGTEDEVIYAKVDLATYNLIRVGHQVMLRDASDYLADRNAKVTTHTIESGPVYSIGCKLLEADTSNLLAGADTIFVIGNINPEGSEMPAAILRDSQKNYNYTQIFRTPLSITRTAMQTKIRITPDEYLKQKREALEMHGIEMEMAFWFGLATEKTGTNGHPERTTKGLVPFIKDNAGTNISDYTLADSGFDGSYGGKTWIEVGGGDDWLQEMLERVFSYGGADRLAMCGPGALLAIQRLASAHGTIQLIPGATMWGMAVATLITPFGNVSLKTHPLWRKQASMRNTMVVFEPKNLHQRTVQDTIFHDDPDGNNKGNTVDGKNEEFLTEIGLEMHHPQTCGIFYGVGKDNPA